MSTNQAPDAQTQQQLEALKEIELEVTEEVNTTAGYDYDEVDKELVVPRLEESITVVITITKMFFDNEFDEALAVCEKYEKHSLYHSLGKSFLRFLYGLLTLEPVRHLVPDT